MTVQLEDIRQAQARIAPYLQPTPLEAAPGLGENVWLKLENANKTHSFKVRGAFNALLSMPEEVRARRIVSASSGNHAQAIAYVSGLLGIKARVLMPVYTAKRKVAGVIRYGAEAVLFGDEYDKTEHEALRIARDERLTYVSAYSNPLVIAGGGTIGLEIADALPTVERVIVPCGGGGLVSGIAAALKSLKPSVEVIGVNPEVSPDMYNVFYKAQKPLSHESLADALPGEIEAGSMTLEMVPRLVDRMVCVSEPAIVEAMRWMVAEQGWMAEGGAVVGVAALQSGVVAADKLTVVVITGGNVDADRLAKVLMG